MPISLHTYLKTVRAAYAHGLRRATAAAAADINAAADAVVAARNCAHAAEAMAAAEAKRANAAEAKAAAEAKRADAAEDEAEGVKAFIAAAECCESAALQEAERARKHADKSVVRAKAAEGKIALTEVKLGKANARIAELNECVAAANERAAAAEARAAAAEEKAKSSDACFNKLLAIQSDTFSELEDYRRRSYENRHQAGIADAVKERAAVAERRASNAEHELKEARSALVVAENCADSAKLERKAFERRNAALIDRLAQATERAEDAEWAAEDIRAMRTAAEE
ncbi:hypothetical protein IWW51_006758, partial [Coemansia sp. RSA 2702]